MLLLPVSCAQLILFIYMGLLCPRVRFRGVYLLPSPATSSLDSVDNQRMHSLHPDTTLFLML